MKSKTKFLSPLYLSLMNSFIENQREYDDLRHYMTFPKFMESHSFLRFDGGRQSGKTYAVTQFVADWLAEGNSVVLIAQKTSAATALKERVVLRYNAERTCSPMRLGDFPKSNVIVTNLRDYLNKSSSTPRGRCLDGRLLFVFDEVMNFPDYLTVADAYLSYAPCTRESKDRTDPVFFVVGM